jgi:zinc protease
MYANRLLGLVLVLLAIPARAGMDIQHWQTSGGARVYFVENHDLPMLDINVSFDAGSARDTPDKSGLAGMVRGLMPLGAGPWTEDEVSDRLADVGAVLSGQFDQDRAGFSLRTLSGQQEREQAVSVLRAILSAPRFTPEVLDREKARAVAELQEAATKPEYLGEKAFRRAIYGDHPYGLPEAGEVETVSSLTREDVLGFYESHYRAKNMSIALMGDLPRTEAEKLAEGLAADLPPGEAPPPLPRVAIKIPGIRLVIPHHAAQSHLFMGQPGLRREDSDYFPLVVGNYVLGSGGFDSRLMNEIRQKRGLAYSAYSYFAPLERLGPFQLGLQTRRETTDEAVRVADQTLRRFLEQGPTEEELKQAKDNLVGSFPLRLDSNRKILEYLAMMAYYRLPLDWLDDYPEQVEKVSKADVLKAFRDRIRPEALSTVIVGGQLGPGK